jgi:malonyl CoA-acyl carrier protein transacylase
MQFALTAGATKFVEIGPSDVLIGLMRRIDRNTQRMAVNTPDGVRSLIQTLSGTA